MRVTVVRPLGVLSEVRLDSSTGGILVRSGNAEIIDTVHARRTPMISASAGFKT